MSIHTSSEGVSMAKRLEDESAQMYEKAAAGDSRASELFSRFASENRRHIQDISRTYYGVITDAIEGGYCLDLEPQTYELDLGVRSASKLHGNTELAINVERRIASYYSDAADQMSSLMADLTYTFRRLSKRHLRRVSMLEESVQS